jgi:hypothetical protein
MGRQMIFVNQRHAERRVGVSALVDHKRPGAQHHQRPYRPCGDGGSRQWLHDRQCSGVQGRGMQGETGGAGCQACRPSRAVR